MLFRSQIEILELLKYLKKEIGIVMTVHDLNLAARYCDRIVLIQQGQIVANGTPQQVLTNAVIHQVFQVQSKVISSESESTPQFMFYQEAV